MGTLLWIVVGVLIGWNVQQPAAVKKLMDTVKVHTMALVLKVVALVKAKLGK